MAQKNNIRSIRFSDELAELIERQQGRNFTEKFENLVTRCVWELPERERQLEHIQKQIGEQRRQLYNLQRASEQLLALERELKEAQRHFAAIEQRAKALAEKEM